VSLRFLEVDPAEAVAFLAFTVGWGAGELPVYLDGQLAPAFSAPAGRLWERARALDERRSCQVEIGLPLTSGVSVLWCWTRTPDSTRRASRFRPAPSMVLRFGSGAERLLLWGLGERASWPSIEPHNERVAYALRAPRTRCVPEKLRIPLPGTFVRVGRSRPAPVLVTRMELGEYRLEDVTRRLRMPPAKDAWRQRA
jgi:hypothetical protein